MRHRLFNIYYNMKQRCLNPNRHDYKYYGGRGITICKRWLESINNFIEDMYPSYIEGLTLDREDVDGNYEKSNCRWLSMQEQSRNKRTYITANSNISGISKHNNRWRARYFCEGKSVSLGVYDTIDQAKIAIEKYIETLIKDK